MVMDGVPGLRADVGEARVWVDESLTGGSAVAECLRGRLDRFTDARILSLPQEPPLTALSTRVGRRLDSAQSDRLADEFLRDLRNHGAATLIVEDDLWTRNDGDFSGEAAFVGDRLIRWMRLDDTQHTASQLLRTGASGYPTNAYVSRRDDISLLLEKDSSITAEQVSWLCDSTVAVLVSAFDAEAWLALVR